MRTSFAPAAVLLLILVTFGACSSSPDQPEGVFTVRNQAARNLEFGNSYFERAEYEQATRFFRLALRQNASVDHQ
ncbi:MAG: hypothetical protein ABR590_07780, partial [Spirochaetia bacterium]